MGTKYKVESSFEYRGLSCLALFYESGHRCGYVGVPEGHRLYEMGERKDYSANHTEAEMLDCNGGINFFGHHPGFDKAAGVVNYWWLGFDFDHEWDNLDFKAWQEYFPEEMKFRMELGCVHKNNYAPYARTATTITVEHECIGVVNQIIDGREEDE